MTGIIGAMEMEVQGLVERMEEPCIETISGIKFYQGRLMGKPVVVAQCGVGKVAAAVVAQTMILRYGVDLLVNTGVAGSLSKDVRIFDLVISTETAEHDMDTSPLGDEIGYISGLGIVRMKADEAAAESFARQAEAMGINVRRGLVVSGDQFIASEQQRIKIKSSFPDALCAEMEGASIGHVCYQNSVPFCIIRAISDNADGEADMDFPSFAKKASQVSTQLVLKYLEG